MKTRIIEVTNAPDGINWGKFLVGHFDVEWDVTSRLDGANPYTPLLSQIGFGSREDDNMIWVLDLQTREGAMFRPGGFAEADLDKHRIWVCPMFGPFLEWLYEQDLTDFDALPSVVHLPHAPSALRGYRRPGPE